MSGICFLGISSFKHNVLIFARKWYGSSYGERLIVFEGVPEGFTEEGMIEVLNNAWQISQGRKFLREGIEWIKSSCLDIWPLTAEDPASWRQFKPEREDSVFSSYPSSSLLSLWSPGRVPGVLSPPIHEALRVFIILSDNNLLVGLKPASYWKKYIYWEITDMCKMGIYYLLAKHQWICV